MALDPRRFSDHRNAFGFLRLLFDSLVIVALVPEYADGNSHRELLHRIFGTVTFGGFAVAGFFLISGFLITSSFQSTKSPKRFLIKRAGRIYPGYCVAFIVSVFIIAPCVGGTWTFYESLTYTLKALPLFRYLYVPGAFATSAVPSLNGALWTIAYEFRCYLLTILLGSIGLFKRPMAIAGMAGILLLASGIVPVSLDSIWSTHQRVEALIGRPVETLSYTGLFLTGSAFFLLQQRISIDAKLFYGSLVGLVITLFIAVLCPLGLAVFGSYTIFFVASWGNTTFLRRINNETDVSYGAYLYASL